MEKPIVVGITGGSGSGKTFFLRNLIAAFDKDEICLVSQDNYYKPRNKQPLDAKGITNFDTPDSIDFEEYLNDLVALKSGKKIQRLEYTFNNPSHLAAMLTFYPAPIIVVEGIFAFYLPQISALIDLKIFIDAEEHVKLKRRIVRDKIERGYELEDVLYRYENHVAPTYEKYIKPFKSEADIVIPNNRHFDKGLSVLIGYLKNVLQKKS